MEIITGILKYLLINFCLRIERGTDVAEIQA